MEGQRASAGAPAPATGHALARIPINVDRQLVHQHGIFRYISTPYHFVVHMHRIRMEVRGASASAPAPAMGRAPAHIPINIDR